MMVLVSAKRDRPRTNRIEIMVGGDLGAIRLRRDSAR